MTPKELADYFWNCMDDRDQALFFNELALETENNFNFQSQIESVRSNEHLSPAGRQAMKVFGGNY